MMSAFRLPGTARVYRYFKNAIGVFSLVKEPQQTNIGAALSALVKDKGAN